MSGDVHQAGARFRKHRVVRRQVRAGETGRRRERVREVGRPQPEGLQDPPLQLLTQRRARRLLDDQPENDVVAARVEPPLAGRKEPGLALDEREHVTWRRLRAVGAILSIRLEERKDVVAVGVRKPARVVEELANSHALGDRAHFPIEGERILVDELENDRSDEELGHARNPETVICRQGRTGLSVGDACCCLPGEIRP